MGSKIIKLSDGTFVEIEAPETQDRLLSSGGLDPVDKSLSQIEEIVPKVSKPLAAALQQLRGDMDIETAEVEIGLSFTGEGSMFFTKATAGASLRIKIRLKPLDANGKTETKPLNTED